MCGIAGFWGPPDSALLAAMTASIRHRGPDDEGYFEDGVASLGFRRLSIIDLERGNQPVSMDEGRLQMVYNGEVYNYRELRAELQRLGHAFLTACDTEVVLHAYAEWGTDCFRRFNGMWGLAILDERAPAARLGLARDQLGSNTLFFAQRHTTLGSCGRAPTSAISHFSTRVTTVGSSSHRRSRRSSRARRSRARWTSSRCTSTCASASSTTTTGRSSAGFARSPRPRSPSSREERSQRPCTGRHACPRMATRVRRRFARCSSARCSGGSWPMCR